MQWDSYLTGYKLYLQLEKNLSKNSIEAYMRDVKTLELFCHAKNIDLNITQIPSDFFNEFIKWIAGSGKKSTSQSRILSGVRSFFDFLVLEKHIDKNPTELIEFPRNIRKLPTALSQEEIERMIEKIDLSKEGGFRNKVMVELLFACGVRVSELINLEKGNIYFKEECILVTGKGNKQRLVPISANALNLIEIYLETVRLKMNTKPIDREILFLNRRGSRLTRVFVFNLVKNLAQAAGISKKVSPHTFRHSFATELVMNGADLRAVQSMLGHESITTTEIYSHLDRRHLKRIVDQYHPRSENQTLK